MMQKFEKMKVEQIKNVIFYKRFSRHIFRLTVINLGRC